MQSPHWPGVGRYLGLLEDNDNDPIFYTAKIWYPEIKIRIANQLNRQKALNTIIKLVKEI